MTIKPRTLYAFTFIELLVVIAIIAMLSSARSSAQSILCLSNLRTLGISIHEYTDDHHGKLHMG